MASFGNVHVVVLGVIDVEGELTRVSQALFQGKEHGERWAKAEKAAIHRNLANVWVTATAEGDLMHADEIVENTWKSLEDKTAVLRAKRKLFAAADDTENTAALQRAARILLGEEDSL